MKKYIFLIITILCSIYAQAQFTVSYSLGYATHDLDGMKSLLKGIQQTPPASTIGAKNVDNFSTNQLIHIVDIGYRLDMHEFGLKGGEYSSTGGKLSLKDYSGEYSNRFIVNGFRFGIYYKNYFYTYRNKNDKAVFSFFGEISPGLYFSEIKNNGFFVVQDKELDSFDDKYSKTSFAFLFQAGAKYYITKNINLHVALGYDFVGKAKVEDFKPKEAMVNWSGIRFTGGVGFSF
ncbi:exported hypothetical protein [uncultured Dysgonomonas sp.]|uniref:Outer membrane protein beta-barrel domain-containing protein n=1 Tax=uncultured Dysgonomonas sp. TaxID=206096 RepID=A0A212JTA1_9BACT|nr:hypothetical protein [uncultured Dysgonomonas sp.]MBS5979570.1 hypothetical protein [Dysgonomonas mossii]SBW02535.1 exported hypothetical protein [uncultured Dysgonomonas sp.]